MWHAGAAPVKPQNANLGRLNPRRVSRQAASVARSKSAGRPAGPGEAHEVPSSGATAVNRCAHVADMAVRAGRLPRPPVASGRSRGARAHRLRSGRKGARSSRRAWCGASRAGARRPGPSGAGMAGAAPPPPEHPLPRPPLPPSPSPRPHTHTSGPPQGGHWRIRPSGRGRWQRGSPDAGRHSTLAQ